MLLKKHTLLLFLLISYTHFAQSQNQKPTVVIDDFKKVNSMTVNRTAWYTFSDKGNNGKSEITMSYQKDSQLKKQVLQFKYKLDQGAWKYSPYTAVACSLTAKQIPSGVTAVSYEFKGAAHSFMYRSNQIKDYAYYQKLVPASTEWTTVTIPMSALEQPNWGVHQAFSEAGLNALAWQVVGSTKDSGEVSISNVRFLYTPQITFNNKSSNDITVGFIETMHSTVLHEDRDLWISLPKPLAEMKGSHNKYPVIYLLDGDWHLKYLSGMIDKLGPNHGNSVLPEMIIVGIKNTNRWRDLSPSHISKTHYDHDSTLLSSTGGGENFIEFIEKELIPHIDSLYPTTSYKTFVGHSLGGLTVLNTLINHPQLFNSYLAIDPSLWWNNQLLNKQADSLLSQLDLTRKRLFIATANTVYYEYDTSAIRTDTTKYAFHLRSIFEFTDILKKHNKNGLQWSDRYYPNDDHGSVPVIAEYDGLRYIFDFNKISFEKDLENENFNIDSAFTKHYKDVSLEFGQPILFPESLCDSYGYRFLRMNKYKQALVFCKMNTANYPNSSKAFYSLGEYYEAVGDIPNAIQSYKKALAIKNELAIRNKLAKLEGKK